MKTQSIQPDPSVAAYVSNILVIENFDPYCDVALPLIANGYPSIITLNGENLYLYGQCVQPAEFYLRGRFMMIAYFFYPHTLKTLFGFDAKELTDIHIDLSLTQPARGMRLQEQLAETPSLPARLQLLDSYVKKLVEPIYTNRAVLFATDTIRRSNGLVPLKDLQNELHVTERTFQRLFESHVGIPPKLFSKICQFNAAFNQINNHQFSRLTAVAYQYGYADQSHLIRDFQKFTHTSPTDYLKQSAPYR
ncbi:helix-turn-helix domain-containing protein [Chitinophaga sp. SYP-B3965]|uniref:helix-turn-helix domain-containing protein n=1 Tax=Chitinophaga sp. SYP-B3965 TaxID=2663120 RepID=UPI001299DFA6|nr:helix-turn-helix domain-containing protein [Chitinophaga sp. SYP-B3965]MRG45538.1 helix-turn-helix domain-containing protein [Chitinophaga sp. SYP-B3965]